MSICFIGDELLVAVGDPRHLGWVGRVMARTQSDLAAYTLAVPNETTTSLSARWESEAARRFVPGEENFLVIQLGTADLREGLSLARSRLNVANILDDAAARKVPTFVVGPPPAADIDPQAIAELSAAYADVCGRRRVPYTDTFSPLVNHEQWITDQAAGNGIHPGQAGYGLIAWLVLHNGWHRWLGVEETVE